MFILYYLGLCTLAFVILNSKYKFTSYSQTKIGIIASIFFPITIGGIMLLYILETIIKFRKKWQR